MKVILLSSDGSWFHNLGAAAAKALSPRVDRVFTTGGDKSKTLIFQPHRYCENIFVAHWW